MSDTVIKIAGLSKRFKLYKKEYMRVLELFTKSPKHKEYWALKDINLEIKKGEAVGIIGPNGAGKSTLLKILCGALYQTSGEIEIKGRILSLLELGTGFHPELTGIQNIYNSASMHGFSKDEIETKLQDIIEFADIGEHINSPVKTYSSGMYVRLAFALYACLEPDIYIVDEALSVGDVFFQQKCYERMRQMKEKGVTILMVSHDPSPIISFCDRAILMDDGEMKGNGTPSTMLDMYQAMQYSKGMKIDPVVENSKNIEFGNSEARFILCQMRDENAERNIWQIGDLCKIIVECESLTIQESVCIGIQIKDKMGHIVYGTNSNWLGKDLKFKSNKVKVAFEFPMNLGEGKYTITLAVSENKRTPIVIYSWKENAISFEVLADKDASFGGLIYLPICIDEFE